MSKIPMFVSTEWLAERLNDDNIRIVDATTFLKPDNKGGAKSWAGKETYEEGHIPGAVFANLLEDFSDPEGKFNFTVPPREQFVENAEKLGLGNPDHMVVVYDSGYATADQSVVAPYWATRFAWMLMYEGLENVAVLDGGLAKWKKEDRPVQSGVESYPKETFKGERQPGGFVFKEDVKEALGDENVILMNSLRPEQFEQARIPGSCNVPFDFHADQETLEMLDEDKIKAKFEEVGALDPNKKVITYCGGGIAATLNAMWLKKFGQDNVSVYDGSMSEWTADESLPLEK